MDPVTAGALVTAVNAAVSGAGGEAGRRALDSLGALARRVLRREEADPAGDPAPVVIPHDDAERLRALAELLAERARQEPDFGRDLAAWMREHAAATGEGETGAVHNTISGDARITGPVIQGRDFHMPISFGGS
ncbi:hypothetical protein [Streptomyces coffeae]|uniref:Uncharacterized protein n=1 Tax=Streptomyces coffeae TaxID=621382 RepID=A0ABS1NI38_9ACTN|nr:hypothetical protein [Streptomyces coffeae]MBL1099669.1 hypothetical protein [Streptomyces coffeae]